MERFTLFLKPSAIKDLDRLRKYDAVSVADGIEKFLSYSPTKESRSRIKKLRGIGDPDYRLRLTTCNSHTPGKLARNLLSTVPNRSADFKA